MLMLIRIAEVEKVRVLNFNTSHVNVNLVWIVTLTIYHLNFNTSHVNVNRTGNMFYT